MAQFNELIQSDTPLLVDFFTVWCGPCKMMPPVLQEVKQKLGDQIRIIKIDVDKNPQVAQAYAVQAVPTLIIFKSGKISWRHSGVASANEIIESVRPLIP
jgi:thioredoxin 1